MNNKIKLNGVFTEEELLEKIEEAKKPKWEININRSTYELYHGSEYKGMIWESMNIFQFNMSNLVNVIANAMGYLASKEQIMDQEKPAYNLRFIIHDKEIDINSIYWDTSSKIIDTEEHAEEIKELIESCPSLMDQIFGRDANIEDRKRGI